MEGPRHRRAHDRRRLRGSGGARARTCSAAASATTARRISCTWIPARFAPGAARTDRNRGQPAVAAGLDAVLAACSQQSNPATSRCPAAHARRSRRGNVCAELRALPPRKRRGSAQRLSEPGRLAGRARRSRRAGAWVLSQKRPAIVPAGRYPTQMLLFGWMKRRGRGRATDLYPLAFRQLRAAGRRRVGCEGAREMMAAAPPFMHWSSVAVPRELPAAIARLPSGWVIMGERQVLPGYCLLLPDPVVPHLNALDADAARAIPVRHGADRRCAAGHHRRPCASTTRSSAMSIRRCTRISFRATARSRRSTRTAQPWALDWNAAPLYSDAAARRFQTARRHGAAQAATP